MEEMKQAQQRLNGRIRRASFDRGFHSPENQRELVKLVEQRACPSQATFRLSVRSKRPLWNSARHGGVTRGSSRQLARCSLAMVWIGVEIRTSAATVGTRGWGSLVGIFRYWESRRSCGEEPKCEAGQSRRGRTAA